MDFALCLTRIRFIPFHGKMERVQFTNFFFNSLDGATSFKNLCPFFIICKHINIENCIHSLINKPQVRLLANSRVCFYMYVKGDAFYTTLYKLIYCDQFKTALQSIPNQASFEQGWQFTLAGHMLMSCHPNATQLIIALKPLNLFSFLRKNLSILTQPVYYVGLQNITHFNPFNTQFKKDNAKREIFLEI